MIKVFTIIAILLGTPAITAVSQKSVVQTLTAQAKAASYKNGDATVVKISASRFSYSPAEVSVKKGQPVTLELTSSDVPHGFSLPDFNVRADIKPGDTAKVTFTPDKSGRFTFVCDVFCGGGHEDMSGTLVVTD